MTEEEKKALLGERDVNRTQLAYIREHGTQSEIERAWSFNDGFDTALHILHIEESEDKE